MKKIALALSCLMLALPLAAQEEKKPPTQVEKLIMLQHADPDQVASLLRVFNATLVPNNVMHTIAAKATPETMAAVEEAIKKLDVAPSAPKNIDLTVYMVIGSEGENPANGAVPKDLDAVVTQLKNAFAFKNYGLMDILALRTRTGQDASTTSNASLKSPGGMQAPPPVITQFTIRSANVGTDGTTIKIDKLKSSARVPVYSGNQYSFYELGLNTDVDIREGQKVVIGRLGISSDQALFLVLVAKIVP